MDRIDYSEKYHGIMMFNNNKDVSIHRWYPFVEGYSETFINSIIEEIGRVPKLCLDPFSGSGTTALELQKNCISCITFEVSPFMYDLTKTKLYPNYSIDQFDTYYAVLHNNLLVNSPKDIMDVDFPVKSTYSSKTGRKKYHYDDDVRLAILDIKKAIQSIDNADYQRLFKIALASILLTVSNMYRNGKCLSYKKNYDNRKRYSRIEVHQLFLTTLSQKFREDISKIKPYAVDNYSLAMYGDSRELIKKLEDNSIDLVITSPPYLNSRDYTDSYIDELRVLEYIKTDGAEQKLRKSSIRSHVQVKWDDVEPLDIPELQHSIEEIKKHEDDFWNESLLNMISGYFADMKVLLSELHKKMAEEGYIYFNVANSAYFNVIIEVDQIVAKIAESCGFKVEEIRVARKIKSSSQQKEVKGKLDETVIVMKK